MTSLCADVVAQTPELAHVDPRRVLVTYVKSRSRRSWGLQARLIPLRFRDGRLIERRRGRLYTIQRWYLGDVPLNYVLSFYLPRFLNQTFFEKLVTVFHELYHIAPDARGDVRRFGKTGRRYHAGSQRDFDRYVGRLVRRYLDRRPNPAQFDFLRLSFDALCRRHGSIVGVHVPAPRLIPVNEYSPDGPGSATGIA